MTARCMAEISPAAGALGWSCTALLGFATVYLGEHYVIDLLAGIALVEAVWRAEPIARPLLRASLAGLHGLERLPGRRSR